VDDCPRPHLSHRLGERIPVTHVGLERDCLAAQEIQQMTAGEADGTRD